jgi:hypothetical protein
MEVVVGSLCKTLKGVGTESSTNFISFWAFNSANILLYTVAQRLRLKAFSEATSLLESGAVCIGVLRACGETEPIAIRFLNLVEPTYRSLRLTERSLLTQQTHRNRSAEKMGIQNLLVDTPPVSPAHHNERSSSWDLEGTAAGDQLTAITTYLTDLLKDPYGRLQPRQDSGQPDPDSPQPESDILFWFS